MSATRNILSSCKKDLIDIYKYAVNSVKPATLINESVEFKGENLVIKDRLSSNPSDSTLKCDISETRLHVIGGGKSVLGMAAALADLANRANLQKKFSIGTISVPMELRPNFDNFTRSQLDSVGIQCLFGSKNNLPNEDSVAATKCILARISEACRLDKQDGLQSLFIVLISGGGSACLTSPKSITLSEKLDLIKQLVYKGANIVELNTVRRLYSNVKGGNLVRHILNCNPDSKVITLILSDVIGDPIEFIASGPTYIGNDEACERALDSLKQKYGLKLPKKVNDHRDKSERSQPVEKNSVIYKIIGNNDIAISNALKRAESLGYHTIKMNMPLDGLTEDALSKLLSFSRQRSNTMERSLFLAGGETTVKLSANESWGVGGRVQEFCLDYLISSFSEKGRAVDDVDILFAGSTDGQDGPTDVAACMASLAEHELSLGPSNERASKFNLEDCLMAKRSHDSHKFWMRYKPDWLVKTGLTGTNVMDLYFYLRITS